MAILGKLRMLSLCNNYLKIKVNYYQLESTVNFHKMQEI
ncbi:hypothetical protein DOT_1218 [Desulfosporosinus sp. OT]|nr:hypothetical protein DOT_1218 [Desulfosporosinus sp. OT]